jgi:hypothetical protein
VLAHTVYYARKRGWLVLYIPDAWDQVQSGSYIDPYIFSSTPNPIIPEGSLSSNTDGESSAEIADIFMNAKDNPPPADALYDNPLMSVTALRSFWKAHHSALANLPIRFPELLDKYSAHIQSFREAWNRTRSLRGRDKLSFIETRAQILEDDIMPEEDVKDEAILASFDFDHFAFKSFKDLVEFGVAFTDLSGAVFLDLVHELKHVTELPVLIAVDEYNCWEVKSAYHYKNAPIHSWQLCLPHALRFLSNKKEYNQSAFQMKHGLCIASTSYSHPEGQAIDYYRSKDSIPLLFQVPSYSQVEYLSAISYYVHTRVLEAAFTRDEMIAYRTYVQSNPRLLHRDRVSYFTERITMREFASFSDDDYQGLSSSASGRSAGNEGYDLDDASSSKQRVDFLNDEVLSEDPGKNSRFLALKRRYLASIHDDEDDEPINLGSIAVNDNDPASDILKARRRRAANNQEVSAETVDLTDEALEIFMEEYDALDDGQPWDDQKYEALNAIVDDKLSKLIEAQEAKGMYKTGSEADDDKEDSEVDAELAALEEVMADEKRALDLDDVFGIDPAIRDEIIKAKANKKDDYLLITGIDDDCKVEDVDMEAVEEISLKDFIKLVGPRGENIHKVLVKSPEPATESSAPADGEEEVMAPEQEEAVKLLDEYLHSLSDEELDELLENDEEEEFMRRILDADLSQITDEDAFFESMVVDRSSTSTTSKKTPTTTPDKS